MRDEHPVTFAAFQEIPWHLFGRLSVAQSELTLRTPYMDNALVPLLYQAPPGTRVTNATALRLIADLDPRLGAIMTDMGYGGHAPAVIARARQLHRYLLFKAEWYYNAGMPDWGVSVDRAFPLRLLEPLFLGSHKPDHYRLWFHGPLKPYLQGVLTDSASRARPYVNRRGLDALVEAHRNDRRNCLNALNKIVTLELVQRLLIDRAYE
jgi:asparagine synthase (glutamine-hydrolysing)